MREYKINKIILSNTCYKDDDFNVENALFNIKHNDIISNIVINNNNINFKIKRVMSFEPNNRFELFVEYTCYISINEYVDKETFIQDIKDNKLKFLNALTSKMSLLISNISDETPFGAIVTVPMINLHNLIIE